MMTSNELQQKVLECGAFKAAYIRTKDIVLSKDFRRICEANQCGNYGNCWMCPPEIGEIDVLMAQVQSYPGTIVYQSIGILEDSFDMEGMFEAGRRHALLSQQIQAAIKPLLQKPFLHLSCGCHLCKSCAKRTGEPCRQPEKALPSLEGYGIDVYNTAKNAQLKYNNGQNTITYFGMVLFAE